MINNIKKFYLNNKLNVWIMTVYLVLVFFSQIFINVKQNVIVFYLLAIVIAFLISILLMYLLSKIHFKEKTYRRLMIFILDFIILLVLGLAIYSFREKMIGRSEFEGDMWDSINEAKANSYWELRSPIFSFLFAKIPITICNSNMFIVIYYMVIRSIILAFVVSQMFYSNMLLNAIIILYYTCMPLSIHSQMCLLKDTPCALFSLMAIYLVYKSKDFNEKNDSTKCIIYDCIVAVFLVLAYYMRLNAILFCGSMIICLIPIYKFKYARFIRTLIVFVGLILMINGPVNKMLNVFYLDNYTKRNEIAGFPAAVIVAVAKNNSSVLNDEEKQLIEELTYEDDEFFEGFDETNGYESVKYRKNLFGHNPNPISKYSYFELMRIVFDLFLKDPYHVLRQAIFSTCSLYAYRYYKLDEGNIIKKIYYCLQNIEIPVILFLLLCSLLTFNPICKKMDLTNYWLTFPILLLSIGTMVAMSSPWILRYHLTLQMSMPIYFYMFYKKYAK